MENKPNEKDLKCYDLIPVSKVFKLWLQTQKDLKSATGNTNKLERKEFYQECLLRCLGENLFLSFQAFRYMYMRKHKL